MKNAVKLLFILTLSAAFVCAEWPIYQHDSARTGLESSNGVVRGNSTIWSLSGGFSLFNDIVLANGTLFTAGGTPTVVTAINLTNGQVIWNSSISGSYCSPGIQCRFRGHRVGVHNLHWRLDWKRRVWIKRATSPTQTCNQCKQTLHKRS